MNQIKSELYHTLECMNCNAVTKVLQSTDIKKLGCSCGKPDWVVLSYEVEELDKLKLQFGECYEKVIEELKYWLDLPEDYYPLVAIWVLGSYIYKSFSSYPYLFIHAMKGSGKTRLLKLISALSGGDLLMSMTDAVLFRTQGTLCIDEFERIVSKEKSSLRELLNASYKKGVKVKRMKKVHSKDGETMEVEEFEVYRPIAMANIWGMEEVLGDRCITLILEKSNDPQKSRKVENFDEIKRIKLIKETLSQIQCSLCSVVMEKKYVSMWNNYIEDRYANNTTTLTTHTPLTTLTTLKDELFNKIHDSEIDGRNLELFFPLFITSNFLDDKIFDRILKISIGMVKKKREDEFTESKDVSLIDFVSSQTVKIDFTPIKEVASDFKEYLGEGDEENKWVNTRWVGRALKRLNLITEKRRIARGIDVILNVEKAQENIKMFK